MRGKKSFRVRLVGNMENLFLVVGLGNPGREYEQTRHNAGFLAVEKWARDSGAEWKQEKKFQARVARMEDSGSKIILSQPQTFMNASGEAVKKIVDFFRLPPVNILIVVDDADLPLGEIRLRANGSSGGHHGLESVEEHLGTRDFARLRIGIGRKDHLRQISSHVLGPFGKDDAKLLEKVLARAAGQMKCWVSAGVVQAMNQFNGAINQEEKGN
ncbi:MAG: aminoacyl-tRNA hydrolase [Verrucomicrobiota bacterium]